jgi:hypothetical protein
MRGLARWTFNTRVYYVSLGDSPQVSQDAADNNDLAVWRPRKQYKWCTESIA